MSCIMVGDPVEGVEVCAAPPVKRRDIAGVQFDFVTQNEVLAAVLQWRRSGHQRNVVLVNPHSVMTARRNEQMREAVWSADLCLPDGVGIVLAAQLLGYGRRHRVTGPALLLQLCDLGRAHGLRHFFYGGAEGVAEQLREHLVQAYPGLQVAGVHCPPFRPMTPGEDAAIIRRINRSKPDIVWVALGAPKQEIWMAAHAGAIDATATIGVGAAFDFHSGNVKWAPHWVRKYGLEWAHRLVTEPRRMWRRNLNSPLFLASVLAQSVRQKLSVLRGDADGRDLAPAE